MKYSISRISAELGIDRVSCPDNEVSLLLTDSRSLTYPSESLFFALRTSNNDGHRYIEELYGKGVRNFVVERVPDSLKDAADVNFLVVDDVKSALQTIACRHRDRFDVPVIGITGSRGKTTIKEWLYQLLQSDFRIVRSPRSFNSQIGVPLSVWEMNDDIDLGIFEAGISMPGEMQSLQRMIKPTIGILTNVGSEHAEGFESMLEKCREKAGLFVDCDRLIYCDDDPLVKKVMDEEFGDKERCAWSFKDSV